MSNAGILQKLVTIVLGKFISTYVKDKKGSKAEHIVWDAVKDSFYYRESIAYLNYPIFSADFMSRKEPDILLLDKELGAIIIEVKGITIDNLVSIQGHKWFYKDFYMDEGNPYQQAEQQMYGLVDCLKEQRGINPNYSKRIVVALPYITRAEWEEKEFHLLPSAPKVLLQDDISNKKTLEIIKSTYLSKSSAPMSTTEWKSLVGFISGGLKMEKDLDEDVIKYSYLYIAATKDRLWEDIPYVKTLLEKGKKVIILAPFEKSATWFPNEFFSKYEGAYLFQYYVAKQDYEIDEPVVVVDGEGVDDLFSHEWFTLFPSFNEGQYRIEHAAIDSNLAITAGAGTGKTTVMIQRIMYLISIEPELSLKDIVMITFTRDSAQEMKKRLKEELLSRYFITNLPKYLEFAEELKEMNISTIHSFAKSLIQELGFVLGFGRNVRLKSYTVKRRGIVEEVLNEYVGNTPMEVLGFDGFRHYELVRIIESFWDEIERKGLNVNQIESLHWGSATSKQDQKFNELFKYMFPLAEKKFDDLKKEENAITIGDLVRKISQISMEKAESLQELSTKMKFLFVDEFQDSDDVQIKLVAQIAHILNTKLFVVGDIKQSIYRFRGADYTAFEQLQKQVHEGFHEEPLQINYRTSKGILDKIDVFFQQWASDDHLNYGEKDRLIGNEHSTFGSNEFKLVKYNKWAEELRDKLMKEIVHAQELVKRQSSKSKKKKIALLVRTNNQAKRVQKWCEDYGFVTELNVGGTFFNSRAVKDFHSLIEALLYPRYSKSVLNALATPFFEADVLLDNLVPFEGDNDRILDYLRKEHGLKEQFEDYVSQLRIKPAFAIIRHFLSRDIHQSLYSMELKRFEEEPVESEKLKIKQNVKQYQKNLNHLMNLLHQQFDSTNATLFGMFAWLGMNIKTNRNEDEPRVEKVESEEIIEIVTVHKSKGLEYHTVIIPFTDQIFDFERDEMLFDDERKEVGWFIKKSASRNQNHNDLNDMESEEIIKEETRLLYVAMTRCRERLLIFVPNKPLDQTWSMQLGKFY